MSTHSRNLISTKLPLHSKQPDNADKVPKYLAHQNRGCNRKVLLPLYSSLIRSILDYWSSVYGLAPHSHLSLLDPVQNAAISICTGAFRTCPQFSLCAEAVVPLLEYRRLFLTANLLSSILLLPKTQIHNIHNSLCIASFTVRRLHKWGYFFNHGFSKNVIFHCLNPFFPLSYHGPCPRPTLFSSYVVFPKNLSSHLFIVLTSSKS